MFIELTEDSKSFKDVGSRTWNNDLFFSTYVS